MTNRQRIGLVLGATTLLFSLAFAMAYFGQQDENGDGLPTIDGVRNNGMKASYELLGQYGYKVERWTKPINTLPAEAAGVTVFDFSPAHSADDYSSLLAFTSRGGRVVNTGLRLLAADGEPFAANAPRRPSHDLCQPTTPSPINRGGAITMSGARRWGGSDGAIPLYQDSEGRVVAARSLIGSGDAIWLADLLPLSNAGLREAHNADLLFHLVEGSRRVIFYEQNLAAAAKSRDENWRRELDTANNWLLAQFLFAALLLTLARSRRAGPLASQPEPSRQHPLEFVRSLGALYDKAGASRAAVEIALERLRRLTSRRIDLSPQADAHAWASRLRELGCTLDEAAEKQLTTAIGDEKPNVRRAVAHVRFLNRLSAQLERRPGRKKN